jgi:hypothetical protein
MFISKPELVSYVQALQEYDLAQIGSSKKLKQMINIEKLNVVAHTQAAENKFEEIVNLIKIHVKFDIIVHELYGADLWITKILPKMKDKLSKQSFARAYIIERSVSMILN